MARRTAAEIIDERECVISQLEAWPECQKALKYERKQAATTRPAEGASETVEEDLCGSGSTCICRSAGRQGEPTRTDEPGLVAAVVKQAKPAILRLSVEGGGCSGFQYKFDLAADAEGDDAVSETDGVKLLVDPVSLDLVAGSRVDFVEDLGGAAFKVENPQAAAGCGCGSSFGI